MLKDYKNYFVLLFISIAIFACAPLLDENFEARTIVGSTCVASPFSKLDNASLFSFPIAADRLQIIHSLNRLAKEVSEKGVLQSESCVFWGEFIETGKYGQLEHHYLSYTGTKDQFCLNHFDGVFKGEDIELFSVLPVIHASEGNIHEWPKSVLNRGNGLRGPQRYFASVCYDAASFIKDN